MNSIMYISELFQANQNFMHQLTTHSNNQYHSHEFIEIFYVTFGSALQKINNSTTLLSVGDLYLLRSTDKHAFSSDNPDFCHRDFLVTPEKFKSICCFFSKDFYDYIMKERMPLQITLSTHEMEALENAFSSINTIKNSETQESTYSFILSNILFSIYKASFTSPTSTPSVWMNDLITKLNSPYNFTTPINEILSDFPYSQPYICRVFKQYTGKTPVQYFNDVRLSQAYLLIKSSTTSISKIAESTGFYHRSFFYKIFKEKYGITPSQVKKGILPIKDSQID